MCPCSLRRTGGRRCFRLSSGSYTSFRCLRLCEYDLCLRLFLPTMLSTTSPLRPRPRFSASAHSSKLPVAQARELEKQAAHFILTCRNGRAELNKYHRRNGIPSITTIRSARYDYSLPQFHDFAVNTVCAPMLRSPRRHRNAHLINLVVENTESSGSTQLWPRRLPLRL